MSCIKVMIFIIKKEERKTIIIFYNKKAFSNILVY